MREKHTLTITLFLEKTRKISFKGLTHHINNKTLSTIIILFGMKHGIYNIGMTYPLSYTEGLLRIFFTDFSFSRHFLFLFLKYMYICFRFLLPTFWRLSLCYLRTSCHSYFLSCFWKPPRKKMTLIFLCNTLSILFFPSSF